NELLLALAGFVRRGRPQRRSEICDGLSEPLIEQRRLEPVLLADLGDRLLVHEVLLEDGNLLLGRELSTGTLRTRHRTAPGCVGNTAVCQSRSSRGRTASVCLTTMC